MLIITSAAYVPAELISDLGQLPPTLLPLGNRRLFLRQLDTVANLNELIVLSLPNDFELERHDAEALQVAGVHLQRTDPSWPLGQSLLHILGVCQPQAGEPVRILHGDTLQIDIPLDLADVVAIAPNDGYYPRALVTVEEQRFISAVYQYCQPGDQVLTGYMSFADSERFISLLAKGIGFVEVVNRYQAESGGALQAYSARKWTDCGHVNAYYRSRANHTTERVFNELCVERHYIRKRGDNSHKIHAEIEWFSSLPPVMHHYSPQIGASCVDPENTYYDIEYLYALPLSDLYVFGRVPVEDWGTIFIRCMEFLSECSAYSAPNEFAQDWRQLYLPKTMKRLEEFSRASGWDLDQPSVMNGESLPSLRAVAESSQTIIDSEQNGSGTLVHGDFCFSNILYDARARRIKVIDPRGLDAVGNISIYGDLRYDVGKLFHSVVGGYDFVVAGVITAEGDGQNRLRTSGTLPVRTAPVIDRFRQLCMTAGFSKDESVIAAITVQLFLSMLPLHHDEPRRQLALLSRALELYRNYRLG